MNLQNSTDFDLQKFKDPDVVHAPMYIWVWNSACTKEIIDKQLPELARMGIRAFYILPEPKEFRPNTMPTDLSPDYMTDEFLELYAYALEKGKTMGMNCWIYDEGGWPSGGACGMVLRDHPEYAKRVLSSRDISFEEGSEYVPSSEDVLAAFLENDVLISKGYVFEKTASVSEYFIEQVNYGGSDYPDLLNRDATDYFINITHDKYASALGDLCGNGVYAVFTDEPKAPYSPMSKELMENYERKYGESILPYLPLIAERKGADEKDAEILRRWYDLCSVAFCENFMLPCKKWSNEHGMAFTGHLDRDHDAVGCVRGGGNFQLMRALRCFDLPGIDVIWRQIYPKEWSAVCDDENGFNGFFPRYASSAARQTGTEFAMSESFGVLGAGVPYEVMRYVIGYQAVRGINVFNFFSVPLGRSGPVLSQELPVFTEGQIQCLDLFRFNKFVERLSYAASLGTRDCDTALYYPVNDFWGRVNAKKVAEEYEMLGRALEDRFVDFDIIDDDIILNAEAMQREGICIGKAVYKNIVVPAGAFISSELEAALNRFEHLGGRVFRNADEVPAADIVEGCSNGLRLTRRKIQQGELMLLFREGGNNKKYSIRVQAENVYALSPESGAIKKLSVENGTVETELALGEVAVLLLGKADVDAEKYMPLNSEWEIQTPFTFAKVKEQVCFENGFEVRSCLAEPVAAELGSWAPLVGSEFSGAGAYETEFELSDSLAENGGELDLGRVCYGAKAELNGEDLGTVIMPPYRFKIPSGLLKAKNKLKITVVNTDANWYVHTDYFSRWEKHQLSPYYEGEMKYAKDYADGGLYGPVKLRLE